MSDTRPIILMSEQRDIEVKRYIDLHIKRIGTTPAVNPNWTVDDIIALQEELQVISED